MNKCHQTGYDSKWNQIACYALLFIVMTMCTVTVKIPSPESSDLLTHSLLSIPCIQLKIQRGCEFFCCWPYFLFQTFPPYNDFKTSCTVLSNTVPKIEVDRMSNNDYIFINTHHRPLWKREYMLCSDWWKKNIFPTNVLNGNDMNSVVRRGLLHRQAELQTRPSIRIETIDATTGSEACEGGQ